MDINYDHFALAELDETGKLLDQKLIRFDLMNKSKEDTVPEFSQETYKNITKDHKYIFRYSKTFLLPKHSV